MKSLSILLCGTLLIAAVSAQTVINPNCGANQYPDSTNTCVNYGLNSDKASANKNLAIDTGDTAWVLAATALAFLITPATGLYYAGLYRAEHATNTILLAFVGLAVITIEWILFGYSFSFGPGSKGYGNFKWGLYYHVAADPSGNYAQGIPHILYAAFQNMFATMAPVFLAGAVVGRMKFGSYIIFVIMWTLVVYNCLAHWIWGNYIDPVYFQPTHLGWISAIDYSGGAVIHVTAGFAALATTLVLGKRRDYEHWPRIPPRPHNRITRPHNVAPTPHNVPLVAIGFTLIWLGWFGYTGGAYGTANGDAATALMTTQVAASTAMLWWLIIEYIVDRQITLVGATFGAMCGLVAITPGAGDIWPWTALMFGIFAASFGFIFSRLKYKLRYDDPFDVFAIHGVCGCVGMFMTGLFGLPKLASGNPGGAWYGSTVVLGYQTGAFAMAAAFSFICTFLIVFILHKTIGIRVDDKSEDLGLDLKYHGAPAYYFDEPVATDLPHQNKGASVNENQPVVTTEGPLRRDEHVISS